MTVLITGICGFVGSTLAISLRESSPALDIVGFDNFIRPGSELNRLRLASKGIKVFHADLRNRADMEVLPKTDWVIDAAANPSVLAGVDGATSSRQLLEHNLGGTINLLEHCRLHDAGFTLLSTSRVYSIPPLAELPVRIEGSAFVPDLSSSETAAIAGLSRFGISESFSTEPPVSLYGVTKLTSELLALEYGRDFGFPVWINRCGVLAGAGQFGKADQGIFSFWIHSWRSGRALRYLGFGGNGYQVRDCLNPRDLTGVILQQMGTAPGSKPSVVNFSGGVQNSMSLAQLSAWCLQRFGRSASQDFLRPTPNVGKRCFDIPWLVLDSSLAAKVWDWFPATSLDSTLEEIASHAESHPDWLDIVG